MAFLFENLEVYKKALDIADDISGLTESFPKGKYYLADQLNRASLSIPANIAEGNGKFTKADRINFFRIARGSAFECVPLLEICRRKKLVMEDASLSYKGRLDEICRMLTGLINY
jgi:four helix bundle protein